MNCQDFDATYLELKVLLIFSRKRTCRRIDGIGSEFIAGVVFNMASFASQPPAIRIKALADQMKLFSEPQHPVKIGMHWYRVGYKPSDLDIMLNVTWPIWRFAREQLNYSNESAEIRAYRELGARLKAEAEAIREIYFQFNWADEQLLEYVDVQEQDALIAWARYMGSDSLTQERIDLLKERMGVHYPKLPADFPTIHHGILSFSPIWVWFDLDYPDPLSHLYKLMKRELEKKKAKEFLSVINQSTFQPRHLCKFAIWFRARIGDEYPPSWESQLCHLRGQGLEVLDKRDSHLIEKYALLKAGSRIHVDDQQLTLMEELKLPPMDGVYSVWRVEVGGNRTKKTLFLLNNDQVCHIYHCRYTHQAHSRQRDSHEESVFEFPSELPLFCGEKRDVDQFAVGEVVFGKIFRHTLDRVSVVSDQTLARLKELSESWNWRSVRLNCIALNEEGNNLLTLPESRQEVEIRREHDIVPDVFYEGIVNMPEIPQWRIDLFEHADSVERSHFREEMGWGSRWGNDSKWGQESRESLVAAIKPIAYKWMPQFTQAEVDRAVEAAFNKLDEPMDARSRFLRAKPHLCGMHVVKWVLAAAKESTQGVPQTAIDL